MKNQPDIVKNVLYVDMENSLYHSLKDYYSSSDFKNLLTDPLSFYNKFMGNEPTTAKYQDAMDFGTYVHALILEPDKIEGNFVQWDKIRRGKDWEAFKARNHGKIIISKKDVENARTLSYYIRGNETAQSLLRNGRAEVSLFSELMGLPVKVRADYIIEEQDHVKVIDIKTTSDMAIPGFARSNCQRSNYDVSAALYSSVFSNFFEKPTEFYFIFVHKNPVHVLTYKCGQEFLDRGAEKLLKSAERIKQMGKGEVPYDNTIYTL